MEFEIQNFVIVEENCCVGGEICMGLLQRLRFVNKLLKETINFFKKDGTNELIKIKQIKITQTKNEKEENNEIIFKVLKFLILCFL